MQFRFLLSFFSVAILSVVAASDAVEELHFLFKRDKKLPFNELPNTNCGAVSSCSNIQGSFSCRCNDVLTVCQNDKQFCWGSKTLQSNECPSIPAPCSNQFNGTASCLCNSEHVLCVDSYNNYCFGNVAGTGPQASVSVGPIPVSGSPSSPSSSPSPSTSANQPNNDNNNQQQQQDKSNAAGHLMPTMHLGVLSVFLYVLLH
ncbi:uncharacterized protein BYT42DRAFT_562588 [Radiomyces spectabilis]|uniref:uncharacterized protein n=1 Tax=Radiomyces spectabilis TaxID=64574 RepID=UPI00221FB473|nr:uncharacterized protein BYT42DRAFT_562588 [Radiomyces spectabilis]KAI8384456.1 hypothetical protein BYT42DRAFT_562588 [Radiomyces spectabilis]